jgi:hypothetical protein
MCNSRWVYYYCYKGSTFRRDRNDEKTGTSDEKARDRWEMEDDVKRYMAALLYGHEWHCVVL